MDKPYSIFKRSTGIYYVQFALPDGSRSTNKSTGTRDRREAEMIAMNWCINGNIPENIKSEKKEKNRLQSVDKIGFFNSFKLYDFDDKDVEKILGILKDRKFIISAVRPNTQESLIVDEYLMNFWNYEKSPYVKDSLIQGKSISVSYCATMFGRIKNYWMPALSGKTIGSITTDDLKKVLADEKVQCLASKTINGIIDAITIPMKWAFNNKYTENVCFEGLRRKSVKSKEREILTMDQANAIMNIYWDNDMAKLANEVAMHTGMRAGEIAALRVKDIQEDGIHVTGSYSRYVGLKCCKNGEEREIPIPVCDSLRNKLLAQARINPVYDGKDSYIFFGMNPTKPACSKQWNKYLKRALKEIHYPEPESICFHSWRHFFCSRMLDQIADKRIVMALSGHKTTVMLDYYGKHIEDEKALKIVNEAVKSIFIEN